MKLLRSGLFNVLARSGDKKFILQIALLLIFPMLCDSCHKDSTPLPVIIDIKLGYLAQQADGVWQVTLFNNQNQISSSDLEKQAMTYPALPGIYLNLSEQHVDCETINFYAGSTVLDSLQYIFNLATTKDHEIFAPGKNGSVVAKSDGSNSPRDCNLGLEYRFNVKITGKAVPNNDTLELNAIDTIRLNYRSLYSAKTFSSTIAVTQ